MVGLVIYHKHLLVNAKLARPMQTEQQGIDFLTSLVSDIDMKILQGPFATYVTAEGNRGLTAIVLIETSHIAFHIWDEPVEPVLQFDLYTCGVLHHHQVLDSITHAFQITSADWVLFDRELGFHVEDQGRING